MNDSENPGQGNLLRALTSLASVDQAGELVRLLEAGLENRLGEKMDRQLAVLNDILSELRERKDNTSVSLETELF